MPRKSPKRGRLVDDPDARLGILLITALLLALVAGSVAILIVAPGSFSD
jgi:hypothetical protein